jgi:hypothetical protein
MPDFKIRAPQLSQNDGSTPVDLVTLIYSSNFELLNLQPNQYDYVPQDSSLCIVSFLPSSGRITCYLRQIDHSQYFYHFDLSTELVCNLNNLCEFPQHSVQNRDFLTY